MHAEEMCIRDRIRGIRKEKGITLKQLSERTGLSIGYLSNLERDSSSPTLDNMQKICGVLEVSLIELLDDKKPYKTVIRKNERKVVYYREGKVCYESIKFGSELLDGLVITLEPHSQYDSKNWVHNYDEIGLVLEGEMYISIEGERIEIREGDAFYIKAKDVYKRQDSGIPILCVPGAVDVIDYYFCLLYTSRCV